MIMCIDENFRKKIIFYGYSYTLDSYNHVSVEILSGNIGTIENGRGILNPNLSILTHACMN